MNEGLLKQRVVTDPAAWLSLREAWESLFAASPTAAPPLRWEWLWEWWRIYARAYGAGDHPLRIITVWRGDRLIGALPLCLTYRSGLRFGVRRLGFLSTGEKEEDAV